MNSGEIKNIAVSVIIVLCYIVIILAGCQDRLMVTKRCTIYDCHKEKTGKYYVRYLPDGDGEHGRWFINQVPIKVGSKMFLTYDQNQNNSIDWELSGYIDGENK